MSRFVMVSFAFLGWGFYELSGGRDFTPPVAPIGDIGQIATITAPAPDTTTSKFRQSAKARAAALVATQVLQDTAPRRPAPNPTHRQNVALAQIVSAGAQLQASDQAFSNTTQASPLPLNSLQGGLLAMTTQFDRDTAIRAQTANLGGNSAAPAASESYLDLRQIRASRVNMRQGPGTIYPVLARLLAGDEVLIIDDNGSGWLQLRTKDGNKIGWVAASLVGKKRS